MRKTVVLIALGLVLLMCAFPVTLWAAEFRMTANLNSPTVVGETDEPMGEWNVTGYFTAGDRLIFVIKQGPDWGYYADVPLPEYPSTILFLPINMSIIDPRGETTNFTIYLQVVQSQQSSEVVPQLAFFGGNLTSNDGGLTMEAQNIWVAKNNTVFYSPIGGIANYNGYYTAVVSNNWGTKEPPMSLQLEEQRIGTVSPYLFVVPIGAVTMVSGITLSAWAWRKPKPPKYRTREKSHGSR